MNDITKILLIFELGIPLFGLIIGFVEFINHKKGK